MNDFHDNMKRVRGLAPSAPFTTMKVQRHLAMNKDILNPIQNITQFFANQLRTLFNLTHDLLGTKPILVWIEHLFRDIEYPPHQEH